MNRLTLSILLAGAALGGCENDGDVITPPPPAALDEVQQNAVDMVDEGRETFRFDTFGSEAFWGGQLRLHHAIMGEANGGVGPGLSPRAALELGLKVDAEKIPAELAGQIQRGEVNLDDPATTIALLRLGAVVGVTGFFDETSGAMTSVGVQCAICHSTVDDSFAPGIGLRRDGWPNRDLNIGAIVATAPDLSAFTQLLGADDATVRAVLMSWGPGAYDAELVIDGKAMRPDGRSGATVLPPAFGLAGVNLHTYTGFGGISYWNAYVANTQMHGQGTFYDARLDDATQFPVAAENRLGHIRTPPDQDRITGRLAALEIYQLTIPIPSPPADRYDAAAAERGRLVFNGRAQCAGCHVPPLYTEPGHNVHTAAEIGIDDFQAMRSPTGMYRTTPLGGLFTRDGAFYHDGRFATLQDVVAHYEQTFDLGLTEAERADLIQFLRSL